MASGHLIGLNFSQGRHFLFADKFGPRTTRMKRAAGGRAFELGKELYGKFMTEGKSLKELADEYGKDIGAIGTLLYRYRKQTGAPSKQWTAQLRKE